MYPPRIRKILAEQQPDTNLTISGWVRTKRDSSSFSFIEINDGSSLQGLQIIAEEKLENYETEIKKLTTGSSITVSGKVVESPGKGQRIEVHATSIKVIGLAAADYPLQKKRHSPEFLRKIAHLRPRTNIISAATRIRSACAQSIHDFFRKHEFYYVHTPIITASDCEGAGEMFQVTTIDPKAPPTTDKGDIDYGKDFFARQSYLTVSGQLSAENLACALGRVYTFGPTFRAENSHTTRHASEFWMIEPEMCFADLQVNADLAVDFLQSVIADVMNHCEEDIAFFNRVRKFKSPFVEASKASLIDSLKKVVETPFERITYTEAINYLQKAKVKFEHSIDWGVALQTEHERYISEQLLKAPVIIYDYPAACKAFYMYLNDDEKTVRAMDVIVPRIGEIIGGSQREDRHDILVDRIKHHDLDPADYWWYLDLRKYGTVPHSGFGLGFERLLMYITGIRNIRDVITFPRTPGSADF